MKSYRGSSTINYFVVFKKVQYILSDEMLRYHWIAQKFVFTINCYIFDNLLILHQIHSISDLVWPIPSDFVPMNIFDDEIDPVTNLP